MSLEERIQKEREDDDGLRESKQGVYEPKKIEEKGLEHNNPTGVCATITDADEVNVEKEIEGWKPVKGKKQRETRSNERKKINIPKKWGLVRCGGPNRRVNPFCSALLIVKDGQKTKRCHKCGKRRTLGTKKILAYSRKQKRVKHAKKKLEQYGYYKTLGDLDVQFQ